MDAGPEKSTWVDLVAGAKHLDRLTWLPEQTSLDGLTRPSVKKSKWVDLAAAAEKSRRVDWSVGAEKFIRVELDARAV